MKDTFLYRLVKEDKKLFSLLIALIIAQLFFTYKGVETFPFVHWGMYSGTVAHSDTQTVYQLAIGGQNIKMSTLTDCEQGMVLNTIKKYNSMQIANGKEKEEVVIDERFSHYVRAETLAEIKSKLLNSKKSISKYPAWLMEYVADMRMLTNTTISISKSKLIYTKEGAITISSPTTLCEYNAE